MLNIKNVGFWKLFSNSDINPLRKRALFTFQWVFELGNKPLWCENEETGNIVQKTKTLMVLLQYSSKYLHDHVNTMVYYNVIIQHHGKWEIRESCHTLYFSSYNDLCQKCWLCLEWVWKITWIHVNSVWSNNNYCYLFVIAVKHVTTHTCIQTRISHLIVTVYLNSAIGACCHMLKNNAY